MIQFLKKALQAMIHDRGQQHSWLQLVMPNTKFDYAKEVGDGLNSNVVMAPILWLSRNFPEASVAVKKKSGDESEIDHEHPLAVLTRMPNKFYSGQSLWTGTILSFCLDGNAYWIKVRNGAGAVVELWYVPHWMIEPKWNNNDFISYYEYKPSSMALRLEIEDVVHLRNGIDPRNVRKGLSPLGSALREVFMDNEASNYVASLLRNAGVPGMVISPQKDVSFSPEDIESTKQYIKTKFSGDRRGEPLVLGAATDVEAFGFPPNQMDLSAVRDLSEERVCALLGIPAAIVGFGTGLQQTKVGATMEEMRRLAWTGGILPMQSSMAAELTRSLLPDFDESPGDEVIFDVTGVRAMQDDLNQQAERIERAVRGGWMTIAEARELSGLEVRPTDEIFLRPLAAIEVGVNERQADFAPAQVPTPSTEPQPPKSKSINTKRLTRRQTQLLRASDRVRRALQRGLQSRLVDFFKRMGDALARAYAEIPKADEDELRVEVIFSSIDLPKFRNELRGIFGSHYVHVFNQTVEALGGIGVGVRLPDTVQLEILSLGGSRAGLVDLNESLRDRAFQVLTQARSEGLGVDATARRLRDIVPSGPWSSPEVRAEIIARTETRFAQTESALRAYKELEGVARVMIIDARLGPTDQECEDMNGQEVSFDEARSLLAQEHPNGTRDVVPIFAGEA